MEIDKAKRVSTAFSTYLPHLRNIIASYRAPRILELGGGRKPAFTLDQLPFKVSSYTVNDISAEELALTPSGYDTALFDVTGDVSRFSGQFDVVFSKTLMEHVRDGETMHRNVLSLLKPGGTAFHMGPTLYAPAFVLNWLLPEDLTRRALHVFFPKRRSKKPKFPAYYSWCFGNRNKMEQMLRRVGYQEIEIRNYYGHNYFKRIPVIATLDKTLATLAAHNDWETFGSFVQIVARRPCLTDAT